MLAPEAGEPLFAELHLLLDTDPHQAAFNMAVDEALLSQLTLPLLRWYRWAQPAVSFGYFGRLADVAPQAAGRALVRRWTGGGVVPHGEDFTYSLIIPSSHPTALVTSALLYQHVHATLTQFLPGAELATSAPAKVSGACFENPVVSDVLLQGRKIAGAAHRRVPHGLLHQGSVQAGELGAAFAHTLAAALSKKVTEVPLRQHTVEAAAHLSRMRYGTSEWLQKR